MPFTDEIICQKLDQLIVLLESTKQDMAAHKENPLLPTQERGQHSSERLLTDRQAAEMFGVSRSWFRQKRVCGGGPEFVKVGRAVRYRESSLRKWLEGYSVTHTSQSVPVEGLVPKRSRRSRYEF
jgi:predicted DNA-binding transcriptional regulator AlpA